MKRSEGWVEGMIQAPQTLCDLTGRQRSLGLGGSVWNEQRYWYVESTARGRMRRYTVQSIVPSPPHLFFFGEGGGWLESSPVLQSSSRGLRFNYEDRNED